MLDPETIESSFIGMAEPPASPYSKSVVVGAGRAIAGKLPMGDEAIEAYRIAHSWRNSHVLPMRRIRHELAWRSRRIQDEGLHVVARLKRMQSIRKKLSQTNYSLYQMQDLGGCRAILDSMSSVSALLDVYRSGGANRPIGREDDYVESPKADGYRCRHLIFKFNGPDDDQDYGRHFVEVQIRTQLQHAWATAVEAVGLFENEDIKGGQGDPKWRRLFQIVSSDFAREEGSPIVPGTSEDEHERRRELVELAGDLDALKMLDGIREAIHFSDNVLSSEARYYMIRYDYVRREVHIRPHAYLPSGLIAYVEQEQEDGFNTVLVEVDKLSDLKAAYPNYFLDVGLFTEKLRQAVSTELQTRASPWRPAEWYAAWLARRRGR